MRARGAGLIKPLLAYLAAAFVFTWPLAAHPLSYLGAPSGPAPDPALNLWILGWDLQTLTHHPAALFSGRIFDANIFYPATTTLAYSDHLIPQALVLWPLFAITHQLVLCYNTLLVASIVASALAMHYCARSISRSEWGAYAAGLIWGFWPFHVAQLIHIQLQALYCLPLMFLYLYRLVMIGRRSDAIRLGVVAAVQTASSIYYGMIGAVALIVGLTVLALTTGRWRRRALLPHVAVAALAASVLIAPLLWPYWQVERDTGFARNLYQAAQAEARPGEYLRVPALNLMYGTSGVLRPSANDRDGPEHQLFPGFVAIALALAGIVNAGRRRRAMAWTLAAIGLAGFVLSLGPDGARAVYALLYNWVFGFQAIRAPARFAVLVAFAIAGLAAIGTRQVARRSPVAAAVLLTLLALEYVNVPIPYVNAPQLHSEVDEWLARAPEPGAVLYLPLGFDANSTPFMLESLEHLRPIVNGYSGQRPAFYSALVEEMRNLPSTESLSTLESLDVRFVVSPRPLVWSAPIGSEDASPNESPLVEREALDGRFIYELRRVPLLEAARLRSDAPPPPPMTHAPFIVGDTATYHVSWVGAARTVDLPAGIVTFTVGAGEGATGAYHLEMSAQTAAWVSPFFEAHDRFDAWTDAMLVPLRYEEHIQEGRRVLNRTAQFKTADAAGNEVVVANGITFPVQRWTRDPLSAFFYLRTITLVPGTRVQIPVTTMGRNVTIDVQVVGVESITHLNRSTRAWHLEVRIVHRIETRPPIHASMWLSDDAGQVPLLARVQASFGEFVIELVDPVR